MLAMPVDKLPLWLATINPNKIRDAYSLCPVAGRTCPTVRRVPTTPLKTG